MLLAAARDGFLKLTEEVKYVQFQAQELKEALETFENKMPGKQFPGRLKTLSQNYFRKKKSTFEV